ncbi:hypothetical protein GSI_04235 [Ganoderma sinense ZZ0214-1]|uniref:Uncharacterized protein n=1 Tax=Ganoderma sinense ZZ0214-1 TaxID=1077348 RepID=A0A2G8SIM1_9APHY|nr:hypothetical protein GSI_04235 [Ganoderma sinense ZZ0214-1]
MVQTFILTRTFAISALAVGAFPITYAAPIQRPEIVVHQMRGNYPRGCRLMGCLYALPTGTDTATTETTTSTPSSDDSLGVIDLLISALTSARNSLASTSSTATSATVDAVVEPASSSVEDLIESLASAAEASVVPAVEVTPVESEAASLDAIV